MYVLKVYWKNYDWNKTQMLKTLSLNNINDKNNALFLFERQGSSF